jgi:hypothetical protein
MWTEHREDKVHNIYGRSEMAPNGLRHVCLLWSPVDVAQDEKQCCDEPAYVDTVNSVSLAPIIATMPPIPSRYIMIPRHRYISVVHLDRQSFQKGCRHHQSVQDLDGQRHVGICFAIPRGSGRRCQSVLSRLSGYFVIYDILREL